METVPAGAPGGGWRLRGGLPRAPGVGKSGVEPSEGEVKVWRRPESSRRCLGGAGTP